MNTQPTKAGLRERIRSRRAARLSTPAEVIDSELLCEHGWSIVTSGTGTARPNDQARRADSLPGEAHGPAVLAYASLPGEPNLDPLLDRILEAGGSVYLPVVTKVGSPLLFGRVTGSMRSISPQGKWGIREPAPELDSEELLSAEVALDFVFVPALGFSSVGARLGNGGGFYDRTFGPLGRTPLGQAPLAKRSRPDVYGVCFSVELGLPGLVAEDWDLHIPRAVAETGVHEFDSSSV